MLLDVKVSVLYVFRSDLERRNRHLLRQKTGYSQAEMRKTSSIRLRVVPIFPRDSSASDARARVKITPLEYGGTRRLAFLEWGDFHARSRFARSAIPEEKWGLLIV